MKMKSEMKKRLTALMLVFCLLVTLTVSALAADPENGGADETTASEDYDGLLDAGTYDIPEDAVYLSTARDILELAENCSLDSWSVGKTVVLQNDIDLSECGSNFESIPSFGGTFLGSGYKISGLSVHTSVSPAGLFTELQSTAVVRDLSVSGTVDPDGTKEYCGGIVGINHGAVINCSFSGTVEGETYTGGIAGKNAEGGLIALSDMEGSVTGMSMTGGIAGLNEGTILGSVSDAQVNTVSVDPTVNVSDISLDLDLTTITSSSGSQSVTPTDSGGIAGYSSGSIMACDASGTTGYPHLGYNVGGIAGRSAGYVSACTSGGSVYGRKDVGGIVGQAEPWVQSVLDNDSLSKLEDEISALKSTLDTLRADTADTAGAASEELEELSSRLDEISGDLKNVTTSINVVTPDVGSILDEYIESLNLESQAAGIASEAASAVQSAASDLSASAASDSVSAIASEAESYAESAESSALSESTVGTESAADVTLPDESEVQSEAESASSAISSAASEASSAAVSLSEEAESLTERTGDIDIGSIASSVSEEIGTAGVTVDSSAAASAAAAVGSAVGSALSHIDTGDITGAVNSITSGTEISASTDLSGVRAAISVMAEEVTSLNTSFTDRSAVIDSDMEEISSQLDALTDTVSEIIDSQNVGSLILDCSAIASETALLGKISGCTSKAAVEGDLNAGGIAGIQSLESAEDPEEDLSFEITDAITTEYDLTAVISDCVNNGKVTSKRDGAGGIAGKSELGLITGCENYGRIESTDGDYVGGIVGFNTAAVTACRCKSELAGGSYIGGITGSVGDRLISVSLSGTETDNKGSGTVSDCISMVLISRAETFYGAVSGSDTGAFSGNVFVSDELCGLNRVSRAGEAEPVDYETLLKSYDVPENFRHITVTFIAEDEVIRTLELSYGDALTEDMMPEVPELDGCFGAWDTGAQSSVTMDMVITAEYTDYMTTIAGSDTRSDGRTVFYVQGCFSENDELVTQRVTDIVSFEDMKIALLTRLKERAAEVQEQWKIEIPSDGQASHRVFYRTPSGTTEHIHIYLKTDDGWKKLDTEASGSYISFEVTGTEAEIAVVSYATALWLGIGAAAAGLVLAVALTVLVILPAANKRRRKRNGRGTQKEKARDEKKHDDLEIETFSVDGSYEKAVSKTKRVRKIPKKVRVRMLLAAAAMVPVILIGGLLAALLLNPQWGTTAVSSLLISRLEKEDPLNMTLTVSGTAGDSSVSLNADICRQTADGIDDPITCISSDGVSIWYYGNTLYLENGSAYTVSDLCPDYSELLDEALNSFSGADAEFSRDGGYTRLKVTADDEEAEKVAELLKPALDDETAGVQRLSVTMSLMGLKVSDISFEIVGTLEGGRQYILTADLQIVSGNSETVEVPYEVQNAITSESSAKQLDLSSDDLKLLAAWGSFSEEDPQAASVTLKASSSVLSVNTSLEWYRRNVNGSRISCISLGGTKFYQCGKAVCGAGGSSVTTDQINTVSAADLIDTALELSQSGETVLESSDDSTGVYTITVSGSDLESIMEQLIPEITDYEPDLSGGTVKITVTDGEIADISLTVSGSIRAVIVKVPLTVSAEAHIDHNADPDECTIPSSIVSALIG